MLTFILEEVQKMVNLLTESQQHGGSQQQRGPKKKLQLPVQTIEMDESILNKVENPSNYLNHVLQKMKIETSASLCSRIQFDIVEVDKDLGPRKTKTYKVFPYIELYDSNPKSDSVKLYFPKKTNSGSTENV